MIMYTNYWSRNMIYNYNNITDKLLSNGWDIVVGFQLENLLIIYCYVLLIEVSTWADLAISEISWANTPHDLRDPLVKMYSIFLVLIPLSVTELFLISPQVFGTRYHSNFVIWLMCRHLKKLYIHFLERWYHLL